MRIFNTCEWNKVASLSVFFFSSWYHRRRRPTKIQSDWGEQWEKGFSRSRISDANECEQVSSKQFLLAPKLGTYEICACFKIWATITVSKWHEMVVCLGIIYWQCGRKLCDLMIHHKTRPYIYFSVLFRSLFFCIYGTLLCKVFQHTLLVHENCLCGCRNGKYGKSDEILKISFPFCLPVSQMQTWYLFNNHLNHFYSIFFVLVLVYLSSLPYFKLHLNTQLYQMLFDIRNRAERRNKKLYIESFVFIISTQTNKTFKKEHNLWAICWFFRFGLYDWSMTLLYVAASVLYSFQSKWNIQDVSIKSVPGIGAKDKLWYTDMPMQKEPTLHPK